MEAHACRDLSLHARSGKRSEVWADGGILHASRQSRRTTRLVSCRRRSSADSATSDVQTGENWFRVSQRPALIQKPCKTLTDHPAVNSPTGLNDHNMNRLEPPETGGSKLRQPRQYQHLIVQLQQMISLQVTCFYWLFLVFGNIARGGTAVADKPAGSVIDGNTARKLVAESIQAAPSRQSDVRPPGSKKDAPDAMSPCVPSVIEQLQP